MLHTFQRIFRAESCEEAGLDPLLNSLQQTEVERSSHVENILDDAGHVVEATPPE